MMPGLKARNHTSIGTHSARTGSTSAATAPRTAHDRSATRPPVTVARRPRRPSTVPVRRSSCDLDGPGPPDREQAVDLVEQAHAGTPRWSTCRRCAVRVLDLAGVQGPRRRTQPERRAQRPTSPTGTDAPHGPTVSGNAPASVVTTRQPLAIASIDRHAEPLVARGRHEHRRRPRSARAASSSGRSSSTRTTPPRPTFGDPAPELLDVARRPTRRWPRSGRPRAPPGAASAARHRLDQVELTLARAPGGRPRSPVVRRPGHQHPGRRPRDAASAVASAHGVHSCIRTHPSGIDVGPLEQAARCCTRESDQTSVRERGDARAGRCPATAAVTGGPGEQVGRRHVVEVHHPTPRCDRPSESNSDVPDAEVQDHQVGAGVPVVALQQPGVATRST